MTTNRNVSFFIAVGLSTLFAVMISSSTVEAQCPGSAGVGTQGGYPAAWRGSSSNGTSVMGTGAPLFDWVGGGCATMKFGANPPALCFATRNATHNGTSNDYRTAFLSANFAVASHNMTSNGCTFVCGGGTCKVRGGDALPVELLGFGVE